MKPLALGLGLVAAGLIALGLFLGFRTVYDVQGYECGSAFRENPDLLSDQLVDTMTGGSGETSCDKERSDALPLPLVVIGLGLAAGVGSAVTMRLHAEPRNEPFAP